jgi:predicted patatin/cPLA2 family phospholipase
MSPTKNSPKRALVLAGGGMRLAYHAGVLQALAEADLNFNHIDGTSGGIFNTAQLASGLSLAHIQERWRCLAPSNFMSLLPWRQYLRIGRLAAFSDAQGIRQKVFPKLGISIEKIQQNQAFSATFNVCNFATKTVEAIDAKQVTEDHLIAGMSLPIFMPAIKIGATWYTDAVWIKDANIMEAVRRGAQEIYLVYCIGHSPSYLNGAFLQYVHMIEMSAAGGLAAELDWLNLVNEQIKNGISHYGQTRPVIIKIISPAYALPLDPDLFMGKVTFRGLINMGYAHAKSQLPALLVQKETATATTVQMLEADSLQFSTSFKNKNTTIYLHFDARSTLKTCYGSIRNTTGKQEYSLFNTQWFTENTAWLISGKFIENGQVQKITITIPLKNPYEFCLGLDLKIAFFNLNSNENQNLQQSFKERIRMLWSYKYYSNLSIFKTKKLGFSALKTLYLSKN